MCKWLGNTRIQYQKYRLVETHRWYFSVMLAWFGNMSPGAPSVSSICLPCVLMTDWYYGWPGSRCSTSRTIICWYSLILSCKRETTAVDGISWCMQPYLICSLLLSLCNECCRICVIVAAGHIRIILLLLFGTRFECEITLGGVSWIVFRDCIIIFDRRGQNLLLKSPSKICHMRQQSCNNRTILTLWYMICHMMCYMCSGDVS